ncbi:outer membrane beta-barrel family protein [Flavobacterium dankookense]|uniref:Outer membrane receptor protein involved in Fe transport n=1 Tax=Flavobacterium dankookense TaxID=706186 RepID=A0A4R6Q680_9FLAO|nr:outer membrane beta-barrel family protein [Flavobacterium dankookense]TDP57944.1 outer membrane receptor protein involved in Fe transport [Flavobacterium dankookense]
MKSIKTILAAILFLISFISHAQPNAGGAKFKVTGKVIEKSTNLPLEYSTITLKSTTNPNSVFGGITNNKGEFSIDVASGNYNIVIEFISFQPNEINNKSITQNTNLGTIILDEGAKQLDEVIIRAEKTTVEIKLDKKVYNVGNDLMVKGGTVSDILDNIPSVSVDVEGNVSLRGNENVKILIDGRPSNAISVTDALRLIPADAIDKVEVITNPSARYDAEGGGGILNIILKKGKNQGLNGTLIANTGYPENHGLSGTLNFKGEEFNLFTTQGYSYRNSPGNSFTNSRYLNDDNSTRDYMYENRENERLNKSYNGNFGFDWFLSKSLTWTNTLNYRKSSGNNIDDVFQDYYDVDFIYDYTRNRVNEEDSKSENIEFSTNFTKKFKKDGHKLTVDGSFSSNTDNNIALITDSTNNSAIVATDNTLNNQEQSRNLIQADYVLPIGKNTQFEAGYLGNFIRNITDYSVIRNGIPFPQFTNTLEYKEKVNALYTQFGTKFNKLSMLYGLRWEDSNIDVNQLATNDFNNKKYNNFFPSAFFTYEISETSDVSLSYSKRIQRPRGRQLNPFNNLSSNVNIFIGNPDLDPAFTDAFDLGFLKKWSKITFNTSMYFNITNDSFQFVRRPNGDFQDGIPVIISTPINLAKEYRTGFEFTLNYSPYKWWKLNSNFNFFYNETDGDFSYIDNNGDEIIQNFDNKATSWFARLTSKINLPYKIDWQTNMTYNGSQRTAQGKNLGVFAMNLAFSKDVFKEKATISLNVSDLLNSRKRISETYLPGQVDSYGEFQWRERQITLSFTYRFNVKKNEREKPRNGNGGDDGGDFQG